MAQSKSVPKNDAKDATKQPRREIGWVPIVVGGIVVLVIAFVVSYAVHHNSSSNGAPSGQGGTKLWTANVVLKANQDYGLDDASAPVDDTCTYCTIVEGVLGYGTAISDSGGLEVWPHGAPTYSDCVSQLKSSVQAVALYDPPSNKAAADSRPGTYLCGYSSNGNLLSLRYDGPTDDGNGFKFKVTAWSVA